MKINVDFSELIKIAEEFGRDAGFVIDRALRKGVLVDIIEVLPEEGDGPLLSYHGRQILLYIKDHSYSYDEAIIDGEKGNRFHVAHCRTLESMINRNRYQRYVATNNLSGEFEISASERVDAKAKLKVCLNCLTLLDYKQSRGNKDIRRNNFLNFDLKEFFSTYSSCFKHMPKYTDKDSVVYTSDWKQVSERTRSSKNYTCEECRVNLSQHKRLCHTHHINGVKQDNSLGNLQVLCADCHRKEHHGHMFVSHKDTQQITQLRKEQGLLTIKTWSEVYALTDPAFHGDLRRLQKEHYPIPEIGYRHQKESKEINMEVAWPRMRTALMLNKEQIPGWKNYAFGDLLK